MTLIGWLGRKTTNQPTNQLKIHTSEDFQPQPDRWNMKTIFSAEIDDMKKFCVLLLNF